MSSEDSNRQKSTKISLTGDTKTCGHCQSDENRLIENQKVGYTYEYTDVNSPQGQDNLAKWGVKEGESIDIPIIKVETCEGQGPEKKCKTTDWKDSYWSDIESGKLPDEVTKTE